MNNYNGKSDGKTFTSIWLIFVALSTLPVLASLFVTIHPFFDSLADIRIPLALFTIITAIPLNFTKARRYSLMLTIFACIIISLSLNSGGLLPKPALATRPTFKLLQVNLRFDNNTPEKLLALIQDEKPDIITLQEASARWRDFFKQHGLTIIGCVADNDRAGATGFILSDRFLSLSGFSASPVLTCYNASSTHGYVAKVKLRPEKTGRFSLDIISAHLSWPWPFGQNLQMDELQNGTFKNELANDNSARIVAGDFNSVTWSNTVSRMEELTATRHLSGIGPTWLSYRFPNSLRPYLGLPIDQILLSSQFDPVKVTRLPFFGSDHLPVMVEFQFNDDLN